MSDVKVCLYARVSTEFQSTDMQLQELKKYCAYHNYTFDLFADSATGTNTDRPQFTEMIRRIELGEYSKCIVWKLDRFSRSISDLVLLLSRLHKANCMFVSLREHIDFSTAVGRMQVQLLGVFAEFESAMTRERVKSGLQAAKARGVKLGPPSRKFDLNQFKRLKAGGHTMPEISVHMGFSVSQLYKLIRASSP